MLQERLGKGGMAEVWRAVHEGDQVEVALKVLTEERARRPQSRLQFRQEARAMARLDHPHVVRIHEAGVVSAEAAGASGGALEQGMPYLVMDLLPGGSLWRYRGRLRWEDLRNLLRVLLDALAHAHARGVIHRDLKLANVLVSTERRAVLSDFGLAHLAGQTLLLRAGTPSYMAPEQFLDQWRDFGPWTDLYGFGCLVWTLITGSPPFRRSSWEKTRDAHLREELPDLQPLQPVPGGVEGWLHQLLAKDPARRIQCAADAAWGLEQLAGTPTSDRLQQVEASAERIPPMESSTVHFGPLPAFTPAMAWSVGRNDAPPPPPPDWRGTPVQVRLHLRGAGLGVLGARSLPTVGREPERDLLWAELVQVHRLPLARAVVLQGAAGTGKTHLARWLAQRAHEVGAATAMYVEHGSRGGPCSGLRGMLAEHFGLGGLDEAQASIRIAEVARSYGTIDPRDQAVLAEIARAEASGGADGGASTPERMAALSRHLCAVGARRPVILVIDDAHHGVDALVFVRWLLERRETEPTPVLILVVVQDEGLGRSAPARELVAQIQRRQGVCPLDVGPLSRAEQRALVRGLVGLEGELASRVCERTGGNPAFAVSLVEDWVTRGLLVRAEGGFRLKEGASVQLPDDLHEVWRVHLEHALAEQGEDVWRALELAAVLGLRVDIEEWQRLALAHRLSPSLDAVEGLVNRRLAVVDRTGGSWRFVQGMVRESLLRRAAEGQRLQRLHEVILGELLERAVVDDQRMARHLLGAGRLVDGVACLVTAAQGIAEQGNPHGSLDLCDQADAALAGLSSERGARWRRPILLERARALMVLGRIDESEEAARRVIELSSPGEDADFQARILLAGLRMNRGALEAVRDELQLLIPQMRERQASTQLAQGLRTLGMALHLMGACEEALSVGEEARQTAKDLDTWPIWAEATTQVAVTLLELGRLQEAGAVVDEGLAIRERITHPGAVASLLNARAEIDRRLGREALAMSRYEESLDLMDRIGSLAAVFPRLNLATMHALSGRYSEAFRLAERCRRESVLQRRAPLELAVRSVLLVSTLGLQDLNAADLQASRILKLAAAGVRCEPDAYRLISVACKLMWEAGSSDTASELAAVVRGWAGGRDQPLAGEVAWLLEAPEG